jgi:hypothetical protein
MARAPRQLCRGTAAAGAYHAPDTGLGRHVGKEVERYCRFADQKTNAQATIIKAEGAGT